MDTAGKAEGEKNLDSSIGMYSLPWVKQIASGKMLYYTGSSAWHSVRGGMGRGWQGGSGGRDIYINIYTLHS